MSSPSPSFNSYSNTDHAEIADRVTADLAPVDDDDFLSNNGITNGDRGDLESDYEDEDDCGDFEFNLSNLVPTDGGIRPVYPVFDRELLRGFELVCEVESRQSDHKEKSTRGQIQLKTLFLEDRDGDPASPSSSSEEYDELEQIPPGTYCVWTPRKSPSASPSPGRCAKSNSTGSSEKVKAWKLSDLLKRSKSDGKDQGRLMILTSKKKSSVCDAGRSPRARAAREGNSGERRREGVEKNKRRSYLPYRQDLLGLSVSPQAFRKMHILPF